MLGLNDNTVCTWRAVNPKYVEVEAEVLSKKSQLQREAVAYIASDLESKAYETVSRLVRKGANSEEFDKLSETEKKHVLEATKLVLRLKRASISSSDYESRIIKRHKR